MENTTQSAPRTAKPRSEAQRAASRANGAQSRGPVTAGGKSVSSQNALRHGAFGRFCTIDGESPDLFANLLSTLYETWLPADEHERILVDTMAMSLWRRTRLVAMEHAGVNMQLSRARAASPGPARAFNSDDHYSAFASLTQETRTFDLLHRYEARFTRMYERAARSLMAYRKFRQDSPWPEPDTAPEPGPEPQPDPGPEPQPAPEPAPQPEPQPEIKKVKNEPERLTRQEARQRPGRKRSRKDRKSHGRTRRF